MTPKSLLDQLKDLIAYIEGMEGKVKAAEARASLAEERLKDVMDFARAIPHLTKRYGPLRISEIELVTIPPEIEIYRDPLTHEFVVSAIPSDRQNDFASVYQPISPGRYPLGNLVDPRTGEVIRR